MADETGQPRAATHADGIHTEGTGVEFQPPGPGVHGRRLRVREASTQEGKPNIAELMN